MQQPPMAGGAPMGGDPMGGGMPEGPMGGPGQDPMGGGMPGSPQGGAPMGGDDAEMGGVPEGGEDQSQGVENFNPQVGDPNMQAPEEGGEDEEVIDVDDLTKSQENSEHKIDSVESKIEKLLSLIDKVEADIDKNNSDMEQLKQEFERRNPTQVEKMTLRAKQGYPFNQSPDDYWNEKEKEGNYSPEDDKNGEGDQRYVITRDDVNNITDWDSIYKAIDRGDFHQSLKDILNF
jgi:hypothetical protein